MEPVAIIGLGCRFPGGENPAEFWRMLAAGTDAVREVPPQRWDLARWYDSDRAAPGKMYTRRGGFLSAIDGFDAPFFGIAPREALHMDPQQRIVLEIAWEAMEDAGLVPRELAGSATGVFMGFGSLEYSLTQLRQPRIVDGYTHTGYYPCIIANRVSYTFDFRGPSLSLDTACSSSLVAVGLACRSLRSGETSLALAGGVNLIIDPVTTVGFSKLSAMSPDGKCHTFDAAANGYVRGEGAGVVVLKLLSQAQADGDYIYAVIRGEAINQDGRTNGLTAPNRWSQEAVLRASYRQAGISPGDVQYVEAHGTGTLLGDPIEAMALGAVLGEGRPAGAKCRIGSLKTNIGHLEAAAGIAGTIKMALAIEHRQLPPHLNFESPNPHIPFERLPLEVQTRLEPWPAADRPPLAGVSSFGFGGTNAHILLEAAPEPAAPELAPQPPSDGAFSERTFYLLPISARDPAALRALAERYARLLAEGANSLADVCRAAATKRGHERYRLAVVARKADEAAQKLAAFASGESADGCSSGEAPSGPSPAVAMLFSGQGSQYAGMGRGLYETEPVFRRALDRMATVFDDSSNDADRVDEPPHPLLDVLFDREGRGKLVDDTRYTQPTLYALEFALAELWRSWGVRPAAVCGHSLGEYVAATVAGIVGPEEALRLVTHRARLMARLPRTGPLAGAMAAVLAEGQVVADALAELTAVSPNNTAGRCLGVAAYNTPENTVISGDVASIAAALELFAKRGIPAERLTVSHAFHSPLVESMCGAFAEAAAEASFEPAKIPLALNLTGDWLPDGMTLSPEYLAEHIRSPVQFRSAVTAVAEQCPVLLEIGPGATLVGLGRRSLPQAQLAWLTSLRRGRDEIEQMFTALAKLYVGGATIAWKQVYPGRSPRVPLPLYPFQRVRYWAHAPLDSGSAEPSAAPTVNGHAAAVEGTVTATVTPADAGSHPLLGRRLRTALPTFESQIDRAGADWLWDHVICGAPIVPAAAWLEIAAAAAATTSGDGPLVLEQVTFREPWPLAEAAGGLIQCSLLPDGSFQLAASNDPTGAWRTPAQGRIGVRRAPSSDDAQAPTLAAARAACRKRLDATEHYATLRRAGLDYGPAFRGLTELWSGEGEALGTVELPQASLSEARFHIHPALLDAALHVAAAALSPAETESGTSTWLPVRVERFVVHRPCGRRVHSHVRLRPGSAADAPLVDIQLFDDAGAVVARLDGFGVARTDGALLRRVLARPAATSSYRLDWRSSPAASLNNLAEPSADLSAAGPWLIFADSQGVGEQVAAELAKGGSSPIVVRAGSEFRTSAASQFELRSADPGDWKKLADELRARRFAPQSIVYGFTLDAASDRGLSTTNGGNDASSACDGLLLLVQTFLGGGVAPRRLWIATERGEAIAADPVELSLAASAVGGLARTLAWEYPDLRCRTVDLDPTAEPADRAASLLAELAAGDDETRVAYRASKRYTARLTEAAPSHGVAARGGPAEVRLTKGDRGVLEELALVASPRREPGPDEVEIRVRATGLNFRDVLNALGMYPGDAGELGGECAGTVERVGRDVKHLKPGMQVIGLAAGSFAAYVTTPAAVIVEKPSNVTFAEGASIAITFLTAWLTLSEEGRMQAGERVLIHAAAGGVGLAAMQLARLAGAEVFATAGSTAKRALVAAEGAAHVVSSRSLDFADRIRELTAGVGVDLVLNSLSGDFLPRSIDLLRDGGRFLEIGKIGIWTDEQFKAAKPNAEYCVFDLAELARRDPPRVAAALEKIVALFEQGRLKPLPVQTFPLAEAAAAFRYMAQARHVGKIVLIPPTEPITSFRSDASYLITGAWGGLGRQTAEWMVERGARRLLLIGRRVPDDAEARSFVARLAARGAEVVGLAADVADADDLARALRIGLAGGPPLRGVIHAAGLLDDGVVLRLSADRFRAVFAPKLDGAWNLHRLTRPSAGMTEPLDFFVGYSSIAALLGSPGQANYAAANASLDALVHERRRQGLAASTINWGPWSEVGMAARTAQRNAAAGPGLIAELPSLAPADGLRALDEILTADPPQSAVLAAGWTEFFARLGPKAPPLLRDVAARSAGSVSPAAPARTGPRLNLEALAAAPTEARREELLTEFLRQGAAAALGLADPHSIDSRRPLRELGLDSLMAVELRNAVAGAVSRPLADTLLFDYPTIEALARFLVDDLFPAAPAGAVQPATTPPPTSVPTPGDVQPTVAVAATVHAPGDSTATVADELAAELLAVRRRSDRTNQPSSSTRKA